MKKTSILLSASLLGAEAYLPYYTQRYISTNDVIKVSGKPAYLAGGDATLAAAVEFPGTASVKIWYQYYDGASEAAMIYSSLSLEPGTFPETVALSPTDGTLRNLFTSTYSSTLSGTVQYYQGEYSSWSLQQTLSPPDTVDSGKNRYGSVLAFDRDSYDTLYVACGNCSTSAGQGRGAIYLYQQDKAGKNSWSQTQVITSEKLYGLGSSKLVVNDDLLMTDSTQGHVLFRRIGNDYVPEQILRTPGGTVSNFDVYDNTIALSNTGVGVAADTDVGAVYMLAAAKPPPLKGKPMPLQWSVQQVLYPPAVDSNLLFGSQISLDGDRLSISNGGLDASSDMLMYIYERSSSHGKWSVQQTISDMTGDQSSTIFLRGSSLMVLQNESKVAFYDQYHTNADCLTLQLEDDFGDGWDSARLTVTAPDGSKEYYHSRCDLTNPHKVRYCPYNTKLGGIYHFEIPDSVKAKNHWEITWRVYDENDGKWYVGSHDSKMDFEWDAVYQKFTPRHMHNTRSNNITCQYCTPPPTDKPTPVLRRSLKGGGGLPVWPNTAQPTPTPAPTLETTNFENWRTFTLFGADAWDFSYYTAYYYVSDAKSHRLITSGTLCPGEANAKKCWVDLPDGEYNIRVGGGTLADASNVEWTFCHSTNRLAAQTQMSIKISDGKCVAPLSHSYTSFCKGVAGSSTASATVQIEFIILGVASSDMVDTDRDALTNAIAYAFTGLSKSDVSINSVSSSSGGLYVSADIALSEDMGYDVLSLEGLDSLMTSIQNYMNGNGPRVIWSGLQSSEHHTIFSTSTSVQFLSAEVTGSKDKVNAPATVAAVDEVVNYFDQPLSNYNEKSQSSSSSMMINSVSASGYFLAVGALIALVVGMYVSSRRAAKTPQNTPSAGKEEYAELEATEHSKRVQLKDLKLNAPNLADLKQFVESEDEVLKMMLARGK